MIILVIFLVLGNHAWDKWFQRRKFYWSFSQFLSIVWRIKSMTSSHCSYLAWAYHSTEKEEWKKTLFLLRVNINGSFISNNFFPCQWNGVTPEKWITSTQRTISDNTITYTHKVFSNLLGVCSAKLTNKLNHNNSFSKLNFHLSSPVYILWVCLSTFHNYWHIYWHIELQNWCPYFCILKTIQLNF